MDSKKVIISLDAMGGDHAPAAIIKGASLAIAKNPSLYFKIFGDSKLIQPWIDKCRNLKGSYELVHTDLYVPSDAKASDVVRNSKGTSMQLAIESVKNGEADTVISCGNTGGLMALSLFILRPIEGILRPAIIAPVPSLSEPCVFLDIGANSTVTEEHLLQFAIMGIAYCKATLNMENPKVGLFNIGSEATKGTELVQNAADLISQYPFINYQGFAEGDDLVKGKFNVIVTDGFTGNISLKTMEGTASYILEQTRKLFKGSFLAKIALFIFLALTFPRLLKLKKKVHPRHYNGAMLIGLQGISVKSHGASDKKAFAIAIDVAYRLVAGRVNEHIKHELEEINNLLQMNNEQE